jgi:hypothetical protein
MSLEKLIEKLLKELEVSNQPIAYDELTKLYNTYIDGSLSLKINSLEALSDWCHPKALGDLKVSNYTAGEWESLLVSIKVKCKKESSKLKKSSAQGKIMLPETFLVKREEDYHTNYVGKYDNDLIFIGFPFFGGSSQTRPLAVLHLLDADGSLVTSEIWETEKMYEAEGELRKAIQNLPNSKYCDVKTKTFSVELNGLTFGFTPREDKACIEYQPYGLMFSPPWDGTYET